jgi:signal transduction histidine kinase
MFAAHSTDKKKEFASSSAADASDAQMVARMRLVLAISILLTIFIDPSDLSGINLFTWIISFAYVVHGITLYIFSTLNKPGSQSKLIHWLDVGWFALLVLFTGGINSYFFIFFFFAILTASFRWGFEEGALVTIASAALFAACALMPETEVDLPRLLLRTTFVLMLGYMSAHWGESKVGLRRRLALLRDVSRLSNPRFGVDHTITNVLEKTRAFFRSSSCILVMRDKESATYSLRTVNQGNAKQLINAERIGAEAAGPLMALSQDHIVSYIRPRWPARSLLGESVAYDNASHRWIQHDGQACESLAELLEARSFISAPLSLRKEEGRIYVISRERGFSKADALFLNHISAQTFPIIESIDLLDRMASSAASQERGKIALDLHDTAIQPYIGLKLGLSAVRNKASADNPLIEDLDRLMRMTSQVICDLRRYARTFKKDSAQTGPVFLVVLRQQAAQVKEFYGIDIAVIMESELQVNDRLAAEIVQVVREGLSNICKHTNAQRGFVRLQCCNGRLKIQIENEGIGTQSVDFNPRSITERAAALGGKARVMAGSGGGTVVHIEIPV